VRAAPCRGPILLGITGGVAVGKSTVAAAVGRAHGAPVICTDGFLRSNSDLAAAGLTTRKGFPESYDAGLLHRVLADLKGGHPTRVPTYSHLTYDRDGDASVAPSELIVVEGLHLGLLVRDQLDLLIHLRADPVDNEGWYLERFLELCAAGERDPSSFYAGFSALDHAGRVALGRAFWREINLPNLVDHIEPQRPLADVVVTLDAAHQVEGLECPRN
jgi:type I pantothenate kinase